MSDNEVVILSGRRTPIGSFLGTLASVPATVLGARAIAAAVESAGIPAAAIEQTYFGCVLPAGTGQAPARQAAIGAGIPVAAGAVTINKVCGSGMKAVMLAANEIRAGDFEVAVAGGMESMSNAPYLLERARTGYRMGNSQIIDSMIKDGLWDVYKDVHMGTCAEMCVAKYGLTRAELDAFARQSYERARRAIEDGSFAAEIVAVAVAQKKGEPLLVDKDEEPFAAPLEKMASLKPAFDKNGAVTAANASKLSDGAAALVVASAARARGLGAKPLARIVAHGSAAGEPEWFTTAPAAAMRQAMERGGLSRDDIGLYEINEAFAAVALAAIRDLDLDPAKVNVHGGAVALGHPIGSSGARILVTLLHAMRQRGVRYGMAGICIGGGEATAVILESLS